MFNVTHDDKFAIMRTDEAVPSFLIRQEVPGAQWSSANRGWTFPLTRRSMLALRKFLTGRAVTIASDTAQALAKAADTDPTPDAVLDNNRIVINFEFHEDYRQLMSSLGAAPVPGVGWTLPKEKAQDLVEAVEAEGLDLVVDDAVRHTKPEPIPGFDGTLASLKGVQLEAIDAIKHATMSVKNRKKNPLTFADRMRTVGITDLFELVQFFPLRYLDRSQPVLIANMEVGETYTMVGKIVSMNSGQGRYLRTTFADESGHKISTTFFNQPWVARQFSVGQTVIVSGKYTVWTNPKTGRGTGQLESVRMDSVFASSMPIIPTYPQSEKTAVTTENVMRAQRELFARLAPFVDPMPPSDLMDLDKALRTMHFPQAMTDVEQARERLVRDELLLLQLHILSSRQDNARLPGVRQPWGEGGHVATFLSQLPYTLTGAQQRVIDEVGQDLAKPAPMHRLLQGDVSSGKTTIAHLLMLNAVDNGHQGVILAPTEILAEQLHSGLQRAMVDQDVRVEFLGTKVKGKKREAVITGISDGSVDIVVGTHAVLSDDVRFKHLSTVVVDEQHRFGTLQRSLLRERGFDGKVPDMLVMTATPIPRTGAMVIYGDLAVSVLDELPPGRVPIVTKWLQTDASAAALDPQLEVWDRISSEVADGRQAYVVASLVEDSDSIAAASTQTAFDNLSAGPLSHLRLGMMHGRMKRDAREEVMGAFERGEIDVLVATTVIEVGVNIPNATVMAVLDAGRFGIAQLHQIRGRVGRASYESICYLVGDVYSPDGRARMDALTSSVDGFYLAEQDLQIRGEGALFGTRQSGDSDLRLASLRQDLQALEDAKVEAQHIIDTKPWSEVNRLLTLAYQQYEDKEIGS